MEQGFLNRSNKVLLKNEGKMGWLLSDLAKKVKNIDGKILGRDGKSMKPYQCVKDKVTFADDAAVVMENKNDDGEVGSLIPASIDTSNNHGAAGVIGKASTIPTFYVGSKVIDNNNLAVQDDVIDCTMVDVIIPQKEVDMLSARFENSLYCYFVGSRLAFPVVQNYVRHV
ncbi:hypothetical protein Tco_1039425 [Tanacetum coccineum]